MLTTTELGNTNMTNYYCEKRIYDQNGLPVLSVYVEIHTIDDKYYVDSKVLKKKDLDKNINVLKGNSEMLSSTEGKVTNMYFQKNVTVNNNIVGVCYLKVMDFGNKFIIQTDDMTTTKLPDKAELINIDKLDKTVQFTKTKKYQIKLSAKKKNVSSRSQPLLKQIPQMQSQLMTQYGQLPNQLVQPYVYANQVMYPYGYTNQMVYLNSYNYISNQ